MKSYLQKIRAFIREEAIYFWILNGLLLFHSFASICLSLSPHRDVVPPPARSVSAATEVDLFSDPQKLQKLLLENRDL